MTNFQSIPFLPEFEKHNISEIAHPRRCAKCQSAIWVCLSHWIAAFTLYLDPEPLSLLDELKARMAGRGVWQAVNKHDGSFTVKTRNADLIAKSTGAEIVLADHVCDRSNIRVDVPAYWPKFRFTTDEGVPF